MLTPPLIFAAFSAGLLGGLHCIGMCGGIASLMLSANKVSPKTIPIIPLTPSQPARFIQARLHAGRIFTYMIMGGLAGALGGLSVMVHPLLPIHTLLYVIGNLALIWLGLRLFGYTPHFAPLDRLVARITTSIHLSPRLNILQQSQRHPFLVGMAWGLLPCGLVYGVLPFSLLSGQAWSGALLMLIFGLGALPHLLFAQGMARWLHTSRTPKLIRGMGATLLTGIGIAGLWWSFNMQDMPAILCVTRVG